MPDLETLVNIEDEVTQIISDLGLIAKIEEMEDFMNQNDLKVSITNQDTGVNGLVTYTCTVKDKNNNTLANRVVEWYKGTTLLGFDATDSNGISTFKHRVDEAEVYDVHAVVRGTHAGDDIRMFVKDKSNILSDNLWSGGDYSHNTSGIFGNMSEYVTVSSDWSSIGNESFLVNFTSTDIDLIRVSNSSSNLDAGDYVLKMDILNLGPSFNIQFFNGSNNYTTVSIPESTDVTHVELTLTLDTTYSYLSCRVRNTTNVKFYCDNISITSTVTPAQ